jgi:peptide/nickel transport system substrate-binding protein
VLTCDQFGSWNDTGYCDPAYDALYAQQKSAVDPQQRQQIIFRMQQMAFDDRPYIILTYDKRLDAWSPRWAGFVESTQGIFNNVSTQSLTSVHQA